MSVDSVERDVDVAVVDLDGVGRDRLGGRQAGGLAGAQVEARAVQPALERAAVDLALGERDLGVRAHVVAARRPRRRLRATSTTGVLVDLDARSRPSLGRSSVPARTTFAVTVTGRRRSSSASMAAAQPLAQLGDPDLLDELGEEAADDQAAGLVAGMPRASR